MTVGPTVWLGPPSQVVCWTRWARNRSGRDGLFGVDRWPAHGSGGSDLPEPVFRRHVEGFNLGEMGDLVVDHGVHRAQRAAVGSPDPQRFAANRETIICPGMKLTARSTCSTSERSPVTAAHILAQVHLDLLARLTRPH